MKNLSLRFILVVSALILIGGMIRGTGTPVAVAVLLSPLGMVTMLLSLKLNRPIAHALNIMAAVLWLTLPAAYLIGRDAGDLVVMVSFAYGPLVLAGIVGLWILAWCLRGQSEMELIDTYIRGRRTELVLPQPPPTGLASRKTLVNPRQK